MDLTHDLPTHPYHHEGSWAVGRYLDSPWAKPMTLRRAIAIVERVRKAAAVGARDALESLAADAPAITAIAIRACAKLPATTEERIRDTRAATVADSVMYREALARAARARGWSVHWYDRDAVFRKGTAALVQKIGKAAGPPWRAEHKLAAAAALVARGAHR